MPQSAAVAVMRPAEPGIAAHMKDVLDLIGEDPSRDGLVRTPGRWEKALRFLTSGYHTSMEIPRIVNMFARRLQVQERLTQEVAQAICRAIAPRGVAVMCEASHFCMMMRGVEKQCSSTVTSAMLGEFRKRKATRDEFLSLLSRASLSR